MSYKGPLYLIKECPDNSSKVLSVFAFCSQSLLETLLLGKDFFACWDTRSDSDSILSSSTGKWCELSLKDSSPAKYNTSKVKSKVQQLLATKKQLSGLFPYLKKALSSLNKYGTFLLKTSSCSESHLLKFTNIVPVALQSQYSHDCIVDNSVLPHTFFIKIVN